VTLDEETKYFEEIEMDLLSKSHEGKFALIRGSQLFGTFDNAETAYEEGVKRFFDQPFLVRQIRRKREIEQMPAVFLGLAHADVQ
jgi:hypothetical protein